MSVATSDSMVMMNQGADFSMVVRNHSTRTDC